jgi:hypothetical protein
MKNIFTLQHIPVVQRMKTAQAGIAWDGQPLRAKERAIQSPQEGESCLPNLVKDFLSGVSTSAAHECNGSRCCIC